MNLLLQYAYSSLKFPSIILLLLFNGARKFIDFCFGNSSLLKVKFQRVEVKDQRIRQTSVMSTNQGKLVVS